MAPPAAHVNTASHRPSGKLPARPARLGFRSGDTAPQWCGLRCPSPVLFAPSLAHCAGSTQGFAEFLSPSLVQGPGRGAVKLESVHRDTETPGAQGSERRAAARLEQVPPRVPCPFPCVALAREPQVFGFSALGNEDLGGQVRGPHPSPHPVQAGPRDSGPGHGLTSMLWRKPELPSRASASRPSELNACVVCE